jgi:hypothetical protein
MRNGECSHPDNPGIRLRVTYRLISELKLNPKNPRRHNPRQIRRIADSIKTLAFWFR